MHTKPKVDIVKLDELEAHTSDAVWSQTRRRSRRKRTSDELVIEQRSRKLTSSQGRKLVLAHIVKVVNEKSVQERVQVVRQKYAIPTHGFKGGKRRYPAPPKTWLYASNQPIRVTIAKIAKELSVEHDLHPTECAPVFEGYIFYDRIELPYAHNAHQLCIVSDVADEKANPYSREVQTYDNRYYPIAIRINPNASENTILEFVSCVFGTELKELYSKYSKLKFNHRFTRGPSKKIVERNEYIRKLNRMGVYSQRDIATRTNEHFSKVEGYRLITYQTVNKVLNPQKKLKEKRL